MACNALSCLKQDGLTLMAKQAQALKPYLREGTCLSGSQLGMASLSAISVATLFNGLQAR